MQKQEKALSPTRKMENLPHCTYQTLMWLADRIDLEERRFEFHSDGDLGTTGELYFNNGIFNSRAVSL